MNYELKFLPVALSEWRKLDKELRERFKNKLPEILKNPIRPAARLSGMPDCYKIKQRKSGYRLVYHVDQRDIIVLVLAVGKRTRSSVYKAAKKRIDSKQS
ncbi:MAG: type II toxin-antitoxin system RelE/ParE family toxin [Bacteroidetes bacterium]|nr:type II toxin-antitoxin system RelE/ParE family toxin [Bacteroidota bacterium]